MRCVGIWFGEKDIVAPMHAARIKRIVWNRVEFILLFLLQGVCLMNLFRKYVFFLSYLYSTFFYKNYLQFDDDNQGCDTWDTLASLKKSSTCTALVRSR